MCICLYLSFFLSVEKDASDSDRAYYREAVANLPETESFMLLFFFSGLESGRRARETSLGGLPSSQSNQRANGRSLDCSTATAIGLDTCSKTQRKKKSFATLQVLEVRPVIDWDKGKAVEFLLRSLGLSDSEDVVPIYIGDDRTDEDAFKVATSSQETCASHTRMFEPF